MPYKEYRFPSPDLPDVDVSLFVDFGPYQYENFIGGKVLSFEGGSFWFLCPQEGKKKCQHWILYPSKGNLPDMTNPPICKITTMEDGKTFESICRNKKVRGLNFIEVLFLSIKKD